MNKNYYNCLDGYYYKTGIYRDRPLKYIPYGQAGILENDDYIWLKSYTTIVLELNKKTGWLYCTGLYSRTTIKHISAFLREVCPNTSYYTIRDCYKNAKIYNVYTGEVKSKEEWLKEGVA